MKKQLLALCLCLTLLSVCFCPAAPARAEAAAPTAEPLVVDLDLSQLSGTVVYAQVYNLMVDYQSYLGKVLRIAGYYSYYQDTELGVVYHACIIPDATACCAQGIEFVWGGEHVWPDDYPEDMAPIVVTGRLETYFEGEVLYLHLVDAELVVQETPAG